MRGFRIAVSLLAALVVHAALGRFFPTHGRFFDPFLIVVVFWALRCGEGWGMSVGLLAGWLQDSLFGGTVVGVAPLSKLLVGFVAGVAGTRLLIAGPGGRTILLLAAAIGDVFLYQWLASLFSVSVSELSALEILARTMLTAAVGAFVLEAAERRLPPEIPS
jgi:rod shape-determining protein MreD